MQFFKSSNTPNEVDMSQSIIDFMNENAQLDTAPQTTYVKGIDN